MAIFRQERHVELVPGGAEAFNITSQMVSATIPDELPHLNVFVIAVADVLDPKLDTLARVANLADLSLVPIGRDAGVAAPGMNGIEFLSAASTSSYSTLQTANDAATAFQDRVNALIEGWITFRTKFNAPDPFPATYTFPRVDATQKTTLITAYTVAKQSRYTKQTNKTNADATLARAQTDYTYKQNLLAGVTVIVADATKVKNEFITTVTQYGTLLSAGNTFYGLNPVAPGAASFLAAVSAAGVNQAAMPGFIVDATAMLTDSTNYQTTRQTDAAASSVALTAAQLDQITKAQLLTSAQASEAAALAALLAVCPDFDKHSIPFVPDTEP